MTIYVWVISGPRIRPLQPTHSANRSLTMCISRKQRMTYLVLPLSSLFLLPLMVCCLDLLGQLLLAIPMPRMFTASLDCLYLFGQLLLAIPMTRLFTASLDASLMLCMWCYGILTHFIVLSLCKLAVFVAISTLQLVRNPWALVMLWMTVCLEFCNLMAALIAISLRVAFKLCIVLVVVFLREAITDPDLQTILLGTFYTNDWVGDLMILLTILLAYCPLAHKLAWPVVLPPDQVPQCKKHRAWCRPRHWKQRRKLARYRKIYRRWHKPCGKRVAVEVAIHFPRPLCNMLLNPCNRLTTIPHRTSHRRLATATDMLWTSNPI